MDWEIDRQIEAADSASVKHLETILIVKSTV